MGSAPNAFCFTRIQIYRSGVIRAGGRGRHLESGVRQGRAGPAECARGGAEQNYDKSSSPNSNLALARPWLCLDRWWRPVAESVGPGRPGATPRDTSSAEVPRQRSAGAGFAFRPRDFDRRERSFDVGSSEELWVGTSATSMPWH